MSKLDKIIAEQQQYKVLREQGYREQALKLYPWICGRCAREFKHGNLRELTVHHIDHDHGNNPSDGSNWELLCLYCHDAEHDKFERYIQYGSVEDEEHKPATYNPFVDLKQKLNAKR